MTLVLWSLLFGSFPLAVAGRTPPILYFDIALPLWLICAIYFKGFVPDFSDRRLVNAAFLFITVQFASALVNYDDIFKSLMAIKVFAFSFLIYVICLKLAPSRETLSLWLAALAAMLAYSYYQSWQMLAGGKIDFAELKYGMKDTAIGGHNYVAGIMAMLIPITMGAGIRSRGRRRALHVSCLMLALLALLMTMSRGALLGLSAAALVTLPMLFRIGFRWKYAVVTLVLLAGTVAVIPSELIAGDVALVSYRLQNPDYDRMDIYRLAWDTFLDNPVLGVGPGQIVNYVARLNIPSTTWLNAHDFFLNVLSEVGIIGAVPMFLMVGTIGWRAFKCYRAGPTITSAALFASFVAFIVSDTVEGSFPGQHFEVIFWIIAALISREYLERSCSRGPGVMHSGGSSVLVEMDLKRA